ncbi:MAG: hypothetical protein AAGB14_08795 [Verrucomicrobiota bacterium]
MDADTWICPECGAELRVGVKGCPQCSKPKRRMRRTRPKRKKKKEVRRSWEQDTDYDGLDLPDEDFDYDEYVKREFGGMPHRRVPIKWYWWLTAVVLLIGMLFWVF